MNRQKNHILESFQQEQCDVVRSFARSTVRLTISKQGPGFAVIVCDMAMMAVARAPAPTRRFTTRAMFVQFMYGIEDDLTLDTLKALKTVLVDEVAGSVTEFRANVVGVVRNDSRDSLFAVFFPGNEDGAVAAGGDVGLHVFERIK